jgi:hypothetical protein
LPSRHKNESPRPAAEEVIEKLHPGPSLKVAGKQQRINRRRNGVHTKRQPSTQESRNPARGTDTHYSLMQVSEFVDNPYWGSIQPSPTRNPQASVPSQFRNGTTPDESTHGRTMEGVQPWLAREKTGNRPLQRAIRPVDGSKPLGPLHYRGRDREKRYGLSDPAVWNAMNRTLVQQRRLSRIAPPDKTVPLAAVSAGKPSRSPSRHQMLNRFSRQLQKYADVVGVSGQVPVMTPSLSNSRASVHTVKVLLPYHKEFRTAGLAVTSAEQDQKSSHKAYGGQSLRDHPIRESICRPINGSIVGYEDGIEQHSSSSTGTIIQFASSNDLSLALLEVPPQNCRHRPRWKSRELRCRFPWLRRTATMSKPRLTKSHSKRAKTHDSRQRSSLARPKSPEAVSYQDHHTNSCQSAKVATYAQGTGWKTGVRGPTRSKLPKEAPAVVTHPVVTDVSSHEATAKPHVVAPKQKATELKTQSARRGLRRKGVSAEPRVTLSNEIYMQGQREPSRSLRGKRVVANPPLPGPQVLEKKPSKTRNASSVENKLTRTNKGGHFTNVGSASRTGAVRNVPDEAPPIPPLPFESRNAVSTQSSLEKALEAVTKKLDEIKTVTEHTSSPGSGSQGLAETTNRPNPNFSRRPPSAQQTGAEIPAHLSQPSYKSPPALRNGYRGMLDDRGNPYPQDAQVTPSAPDPPLVDSFLKEGIGEAKVQNVPPRTNELLEDLDAFFNHGDAHVNDRDVLRGLQVAVRAAADDFYDAYIRHKTGLRIRQFLADLKSVDVLQEGNTGPKALNGERGKT